MWLVYDTRDGTVIDGPQTSSSWAEGAPDGAALVNIPTADRRHVQVLRLHDEADAEEVAAIMELATTHELRVEDGVVVAGDPLPPPEVVPPPEPTADPAPISRREMVKILQAQGMTQQEAIDVVTGARGA
jgi:hypothetical protein